MNMNHYLQRIGIHSLTGEKEQDLRSLQRQHLYTVPFENLDVINSVPIKLNLTNIYHKIVNNERGGFCYELNGLFNWLLEKLGYKVTMISATISTGKDQWYKANSHLTNLVTINQRDYLVDVGCGDTVRSPILLTGEIVEDISGKYRIQAVDDIFFDLQKHMNNEWNTQFRFSKTPREYDFFNEICHWNQTNPQSKFTQQTIVTIATPNGRVTVTDEHIIITNDDQKSKQAYSTSEFNTILNYYFDIN
ncbi:arylamine N-acetyltransferase [Bacillus sp. SM2101]|uniref:arylamine N-acetyltransferase family protein n=1 Tax=Bacillus sp. SM2101 TaxID=2805366 RepID=UPI001BDEE8FC|nr:arylamine N-acetyltransferase [Bacillus sp. SM2101]